MSDLIRRQVVLNTLENVDKFLDEDRTVEKYKELLTECINELPSDEIKGEWTRHTRVEPVYSIDGVKTWGVKCQCNQCTFTTIVVEDFGYYRYCPNCGADMRGE